MCVVRFDCPWFESWLFKCQHLHYTSDAVSSKCTEIDDLSLVVSGDWYKNKDSVNLVEEMGIYHLKLMLALCIAPSWITPTIVNATQIVSNPRWYYTNNLKHPCACVHCWMLLNVKQTKTIHIANITQTPSVWVTFHFNYCIILKIKGWLKGLPSGEVSHDMCSDRASIIWMWVCNH